jgi:hypothetical protein
MGACFSFLYGLTAYGVCLAALLYLIGFSANLLMPTSVDHGRFASWPEAILSIGWPPSAQPRPNAQLIIYPDSRRSEYLNHFAVLIDTDASALHDAPGPVAAAGWTPLRAPRTMRLSRMRRFP